MEEANVCCFAVQVGLSQARRLAQGKVIRIHASSPFPVQIDGEPYIQQPGCLEITHHGQVQFEAPCDHVLWCTQIYLIM